MMEKHEEMENQEEMENHEWTPIDTNFFRKLF
jgi:hypothetical protein